MDRLAAQYKARYYEAETLALQGNDSAALDILWELRLKPDLGLYRRAVVNLLIASIYPRDQATFANEAINLVDVIRKEEDYDSPNLDRIEKLAQLILEEVASSSNAATRSSKLTEDRVGTGDGKIRAGQDGREAEGVGEEVILEDDDRATIVARWTSASEIVKPDPEALYGSDARQYGIEGYLRDSYYPTRAGTLAEKAKDTAASADADAELDEK